MMQICFRKLCRKKGFQTYINIISKSHIRIDLINYIINNHSIRIIFDRVKC